MFMVVAQREERLKIVPDWIDLEKADEGCGLRDWFIMGTILRGGDSIDKLMAVTYLSQFSSLDGEFARRPVYTPDFHVGFIPYSTTLLQVFNNVAQRHLQQYFAGKAIYTVQKDPAEMRERDCHLIEQGAQLGRLFTANLKNLHKYAENGLWHAVEDCFRRDQRIAQSLAYCQRD